MNHVHTYRHHMIGMADTYKPLSHKQVKTKRPKFIAVFHCTTCGEDREIVTTDVFLRVTVAEGN